jgi:glyoxylate reductase
VLVDAATIEAAPRLRAISTVSVGFDHIDLTVAGGRSITVTTTPVLSDAVADLTLALITMTYRRLREAMADLDRGFWNDRLLGSDVRGKRLLLVGFGRIGREVAARALAAKMQVGAFDLRRDLEPMAGVERVATLAEGLAWADVVSLHVDLNPSTRHLLDAAALGLMKPTAIVINTARGGVVDQAALTQALVDGRIAGAGLDVLEVEPPDPADPLLALPNVVVLPHIGSATTETRRAMLDCAVTNLAACLRGDPCAHALPL